MELIKITLWFGINVIFKDCVRSTKFEYRFEYAVFVGEIKNHTEKSEADVHICGLDNDERLKICKEATLDPLLRTTKVDFVEGSPAGQEKVYEFTLGSYNYLGKPPIIEAACWCPTNPLLYLRDKSSGNSVEAYVSLREAYSKQKNLSR